MSMFPQTGSLPATLPSSPPGSSGSGSQVHHASLVNQSIHSPALLRLIDVKLSKEIIDYVVNHISEIVQYALGIPPPPPPTRGRTLIRHPKFSTFVTNILIRADVTMPVVLTSLAYVDRARPYLIIPSEDWALERVFLGALIVASKYVNDTSLKNVHWAICTGIFGDRDVSRIEREFLEVLDWELGISERDILRHYSGLAAVLEPSGRHRRHHSSSYHSHPEIPFGRLGLGRHDRHGFGQGLNPLRSRSSDTDLYTVYP